MHSLAMSHTTCTRESKQIKEMIIRCKKMYVISKEHASNICTSKSKA